MSNDNIPYRERLRRIRIWIRAKFFDWPYWRVTYGDGEKTYPLHYREAKGLTEVFNGTLWIDYSIKYDI